MHTEAWQQIVTVLKTTHSQLSEKDVEISELEFFDPPSLAEVDELEREMGLKLPESFRQFLHLTGGFRFDWELNSPPFDYLQYGGNPEVGFLRPSEELTLADAYRYFQEHYDDFDVEDEEQSAVIRRCFPLYLSDLGGNALAVRLDTEPLQIHLLKSELAWNVSDKDGDDAKSLVGRGLPEFLLNWASLGGPSTENLSEIIDACGGETVDANSAAGRSIRAWLSEQE